MYRTKTDVGDGDSGIALVSSLMGNSGTFACVISKHHQTVSVRDKSTSVEYWWNDTDRGKPKYSENNLFQWHIVYQKSHMD
jgi:hypothetical protein